MTLVRRGDPRLVSGPVELVSAEVVCEYLPHRHGLRGDEDYYGRRAE